MLPSVWPKSFCWANSQAGVGTNFDWLEKFWRWLELVNLSESAPIAIQHREQRGRGNTANDSARHGGHPCHFHPHLVSCLHRSLRSYPANHRKAGSATRASKPGFTRKVARSSFTNALELARTFPFGVLAPQVCPYCYNTGYSSPGTWCSYCRRERDVSCAGFLRLVP